MKALLATEAGTREVEGVPLRIMVGTAQVRFFIEAQTKVLTHWASGKAVGSFGHIMLGKALAARPVSEKEAARLLIASLVAAKGPVAVLAVFKGAPVINRGNCGG